MCGCCPRCYYVCQTHRWRRSGYKTRACKPGCHLAAAEVDETVDRAKTEPES